ncbi:AAA family ATPase [Mycobacterium sp. TNTM28]|uniref:AAA family ATPase n=1 Tax=[Mycobacterium] fortunisiensis TaxID=2600579 RepID=A0ABS6KJ58_9MYCO|nr:AAA family ATPase [[Mycobacterium] fortunisiensis]MBU9763565.1 AAA family ATPase [[Mycobacterium] fortunisiensis]
MPQEDEAGAEAAASAEQSVHDVILELLGSDAALSDAAKDVVLGALAEVAGGVGESAEDKQNQPTATFLASIEVCGFRGVGPAARLDLYPAPGLMVVSGRNGSGKSSFAEALELTLTGTSYRWFNKKESLWSEAWQNLHHPDPCEIQVGFTREAAGPFTVGVQWNDGATLEHCTTWTQTGGGKRVDGTGDLGWSRALELHRPLLSYEELGRLFDGGPSALYDALAKLLGLDALADTEKILTARHKAIKAADDTADAERRRVQKALSEHTDERAARAAKLLRKRPVPLDEVRALATGSGEAQSDVVPALRVLAELPTPTLDAVADATRHLRTAIKAAADTATAAIDLTSQRVELLRTALRFHDTAGDTDCPVCAQGRLDAAWVATAQDSITSSEDLLDEYRATAQQLKTARSGLTAMIQELSVVAEVPGVELPACPAYNAAVAAARTIPVGDDALSAHAETTLTEVIAAADTLRAQAADELDRRESAWAPVAAQLGGWVGLEEQARADDDELKAVAAAKKWVNEHAAAFRNRRLKPIAAQARHIWHQLRQESNVDLVEISLEGTATRRKVVLEGAVDGRPTKALSVMSQGELHALALALFLPRATSPKSPFRFVVLDDPIQAMDPSKIDGFVQVLSGIAKTHQVIVFSHDDRLASVIRDTGVDARLIEVVRETGSRVTVRDNVNPALRHVGDIFALLKDDRMPADIKGRAAPALFRMALEAAAKQAFYAKAALAGDALTECEDRWLSAKKTSSRLALAVHGNAATDLTPWLKPERKRALRICNAGAHGDAQPVSIHDARDLEKTVREVLALR